MRGGLRVKGTDQTAVQSQAVSGERAVSTGQEVAPEPWPGRKWATRLGGARAEAGGSLCSPAQSHFGDTGGLGPVCMLSLHVPNGLWFSSCVWSLA